MSQTERAEIRNTLEQARALATTSERPLQLNKLALRVGTIFLDARRRHAAMEATRKLLQLQIRDELMARPGGPKKTEAEELARADERYLDYLNEMQAWEELRDWALLIERVSYQRADLLAREGPDVPRLPHASRHSTPSDGAAATARQGRA